MAERIGLRIRRSITDLVVDYSQGITKPLDNLIRAWDGIQKLPPSDDNSYFKIAGIMGSPSEELAGAMLLGGVDTVTMATYCSLPGTAPMFSELRTHYGALKGVRMSRYPTGTKSV